MKFIFFIAILFSTIARADFIFAPGGAFISSMESKQQDGNEVKRVQNDGGLGLAIDFEVVLMKALTLNISGVIAGTSGRSQYEYINSSNASDNATVSELKNAATLFFGAVGPRFRFINFKYFKVFAGAGYLLGSMTQRYDKSDFLSKHGSENGYVPTETQSLGGNYWETGLEYIMSRKSGLRVMYRNMNYKTKSFLTLGNSAITTNQGQLALQYIHYVDWSALWK